MSRFASILLAVCVGVPGVVSVARAGEPADDAAKLYDLKVEATPRLAKGAGGVLTVTIQPKNGGELHKEAPIKLKVRAGEQVALSKATLDRGDMKMAGASGAFEVPFKASASGKASIEGDLSFYICTEKICARQDRKVSVPVEVN